MGREEAPPHARGELECLQVASLNVNGIGVAGKGSSRELGEEDERLWK